MFENMTETQARAEILKSVAEYYHAYKEKKVPFQEGDRITYAARVFDEKEMCALADATLDFWLTTGRFSDQFEKEFAPDCASCGGDRADSLRQLRYSCKHACIQCSAGLLPCGRGRGHGAHQHADVDAG